MMNRNSNMGDKTITHLHQYNPPNMALGCFIGVMILLVIIIFFLGFSDNRLNQMVTNQNNTIASINKLGSAFGISKAIHHKKNNFSSMQHPGGVMESISPGDYANGSVLALRNTNLNNQGITCRDGSCGSGSGSGSGSGAYDIISASNGSSSKGIMDEAAFFIAMGDMDPKDVMGSKPPQPNMMKRGNM
jgi:hypothetical protein